MKDADADADRTGKKKATEQSINCVKMRKKENKIVGKTVHCRE